MFLTEAELCLTISAYLCANAKLTLAHSVRGELQCSLVSQCGVCSAHPGAFLPLGFSVVQAGGMLLL